MRNRVLAAVLLTLAVRAHAELGDAKRVVPPHFGTIPYTYFDAGSYDGNLFLFTVYTGAKNLASVKAVLLVDSDGRQVSDPTIVPSDAFPIGMTEDVHIFLMARSFVRVSADGELLDDAPRALPVFRDRAVAGPRRFLVVGEGQSFLIDAAGTATPAGAVPGLYGVVAAKGDRFALSFDSDNKPMLRIIDDRGTVLRSGPMPAGTGRVYSDGSTWLLTPSGSSAAYKIVNDDLVTIRSVTAAVPLDPNFGRGYLGIRPRYESFPNPPPPAQAAEVSGPGYGGNWATVPERNLQTATLRGTASKLLFTDFDAGVKYGYLIDAINEINRPLPAPLSFTGPRDRQTAVAATNDAGVTLLVWNEPVPDNGASIYAARVSPNGTMLDANAVLMGEDCRDTRANVATDGTDFLVVWSGCGQANGQIFSANGAVAPSFSVLKKGQFSLSGPAVVFDGEVYLVAWPDLSATFLTRVGRDGTAVIPAQTKLNDSGVVRLAPLAGGGALIVYNNSPHLVAQRLTRDARIEGKEVQIRKGATVASVTRRGDHFLMIGYEGSKSFLMRLDENGEPVVKQGVGIPIATAAARVFCEDECTLVWRDDTTASHIVASTISESASGGVELAEPVTIQPEGALFRVGDPILLRGTAGEPRLLLYLAPDADSGSIQIFARSAGVKRRTSRQ